jgi:hypothetical protein
MLKSKGSGYGRRLCSRFTRNRGGPTSSDAAAATTCSGVRSRDPATATQEKEQMQNVMLRPVSCVTAIRMQATSVERGRWVGKIASHQRRP